MMRRVTRGNTCVWLYVTLVVWGLGTSNVWAQKAPPQEDLGIWFGMFLDGSLPRIHKPLFLSLDFQSRFSKAGGTFSQTLFRPGIGYALPYGFAVVLGYAWFGNLLVPEKPLQSEHRIWEQLNWKWKFPKAAVDLFSRSRFEQRFTSDSPEVQVRFRQFFRVLWFFHPKSPVGLGLGDEMFLSFHSVSWSQQVGLVQNRLFAMLTLQLHKQWRFELGYMHQWIPGLQADRISHNLFLYFFINL